MLTSHRYFDNASKVYSKAYRRACTAFFPRCAPSCQCQVILFILCAMQFPWVALANCGEKYLDGIALKGQADSLGAGRLSKQVPKNIKKVPGTTIAIQYDCTHDISNNILNIMHVLTVGTQSKIDGIQSYLFVTEMVNGYWTRRLHYGGALLCITTVHHLSRRWQFINFNY